MPTSEFGTYARVTQAILPIEMTWPATRFAPRVYGHERSTLRSCLGCGRRFNASAPTSEEIGCPRCIASERVPTSERVHRIEAPPVIVEPERDYAVISPESIAAIAEALRTRDLTSYDPLRADAADAPPMSSAAEPVVTDVETLRQRLRARYQAELEAPRPETTLAKSLAEGNLSSQDDRFATLVQRYRGRCPRLALATTPREIINTLVRTVGADEMRQLLASDAELRRTYARSLGGPTWETWFCCRRRRSRGGAHESERGESIRDGAH